MNRPVTPESVLSNDDRGDDMQRRLRYQATYAAIIALSLLDEKSEFDYIFCEQHEDVLVKRKDGTFIGIQLKTRDRKEPYKAGDSEILKSLNGFIKLENQFSGYFSHYVLAANNGFWYEKKNGSNLPYLLEVAQALINEEDVTSRQCLSTFAEKLSKNLLADAETSIHLVLNADRTISNLALSVLSKVKIQGDLPGLDDIEQRLVKKIADCPDIGHKRYNELQKLAETLVNEMLRAASLANSSPQPLHFYLLTDPVAQRTNATIQGKRITKEKIWQIIQEHSSTETLYENNPIDISTINLSSEQEIDYTRLRQLLADGNWKKADQETVAVMLKVAGKEKECLLDIKSIENFPCQALRTLDQLWVEYSNNRFGFSVQRRIWREVKESPEAFDVRVGWPVEGYWLNYEELNFSLNAPPGHLPAYIFRERFKSGDRLVHQFQINVQKTAKLTGLRELEKHSALASRLVNCNIQ
jgi:hypothetical protein